MNNKETCPWCNKSMEPGTLYSRGGTFFLPDGESFPKLYTKSSMDKKRAVILGQHSPVFGQIAPAQAHICRHCKRIILCLLCILCLLTACGSRSSEPELFFAWTQGYLASPVDEENTIALTLYEKKESNSNHFPYQYSLYHANSKLVEIKIGEAKVLAATEGLPTEGKVLLSDSYSAPLVIIRSKLGIDQNGEIVTSYGKGCYCGAINVGDSIFEQSVAHWTS